MSAAPNPENNDSQSSPTGIVTALDSTSATPTLIQADSELAAAGAQQAQRRALIQAETTKYRKVLADLEKKHKGKRGRYNRADQASKDTAEEALKYLQDGKTLVEGRAEAQRQKLERRAAARRENLAQSHSLHHAAAPDARRPLGRPRESSGAAAAAAAASEEVEINERWAEERIKYDPRHWMANCTCRIC